METYAGDYGPDTYNVPTSPLFWGAVIVVALLVAACLLVGKRNRTRFDGRPMEEGRTKDPRFDQTLFDQALADVWHETDEFSLTDPTRKQRKGKASEQVQKKQSDS